MNKRFKPGATVVITDSFTNHSVHNKKQAK
jgi:hypothetical protein